MGAKLDGAPHRSGSLTPLEGVQRHPLSDRSSAFSATRRMKHARTERPAWSWLGLNCSSPVQEAHRRERWRSAPSRWLVSRSPCPLVTSSKHRAAYPPSTCLARCTLEDRSGQSVLSCRSPWGRCLGALTACAGPVRSVGSATPTFRGGPRCHCRCHRSATVYVSRTTSRARSTAPSGSGSKVRISIEIHPS